jgi:PAS domain S-box-containing protein
MNGFQTDQILAAVSDAVILLDTNYIIAGWNKAAETIYGWQASEVIGKTLLAVIPTLEYLDSNQDDAIRLVVEHGRWEGEVIQPRKDGTRIYIHSSVTFLRDEAGQPKGYIGINRDVSQRHAVEREMIAINARLRTLRELDRAILAAQTIEEIAQVALSHLVRLVPVDGGWASILLVDNDDNRVEVLARSGEYQPTLIKSSLIIDDLGLTPALYAGHVEWNLPVAALPPCYVRTLLETIGIQSIMRAPIMVAGKLVATLNVPSRLPHAYTETHVEIMREVADLIGIAIRQERLTRLEIALQRERELSELKTRFVQMVSHEFRTPLTTILSSSQIILTYGDRLTTERQGYHLQKIGHYVHRLNSLIDDILTLSKGEVQGLEFKPRSLDLVQFCADYTEELQTITGAAHPVIYQAAVPDCTGQFDENLLRLILNNLTGNALKYSSAGKPIYIRLDCTASHITLEVQDEGVGIPLEEQAKIFHNFYRGTNVEAIPGTGLGLSIVQLAVTAHQGSIQFESLLDQGSVFRVELPLVASTP